MLDPIGGSSIPKCTVLTDAINQFILSLITQCEKGDPQPRHFFDVALIGYSTDEEGNPLVGTALQGKLASTDRIGLDIVSIVELAENQLGTRHVAGSPVPYWYEAGARGGTPMCAGLDYCRSLAQMWVSSHPDSVPPIVIHITDGESTDGNPEPSAYALQTVQTRKGNALLFNVHLSASPGSSIIFPNDESSLPNDYSQMLFRMSSILPDFCVQIARDIGRTILPGARGMALNCNADALTTLLNVGTVPTTKGKSPLR
jgi:hypothetical protein